MTKIITESSVEQVALGILSELKYKVIYGPDIAPDGPRAERQSYADVVLVERLREAIERFNPGIPVEAREEALKRILRTESPDLVINNHRFHKMLVDGIDVEYRISSEIASPPSGARNDGRKSGASNDVKYNKVWLFDFENINNNEFLAVNQLTVIENNINRRPDIVIFINGLPIAVIELKNPADENATTLTAFKQFQTYKLQIPSLFKFNEILVASDGFDAKAGTITSDWERFLSWKTIDGKGRGTACRAPTAMPQIEVILKGMFNKEVLLDLIRNFVVFEGKEKKIAAYHQYHAVNKAIEATLVGAGFKPAPTGKAGDKRCGVVWHTQGSGKSLIMAFYTGKLVLTLDNPTVVVLTDRNDLDDQLFGTFSRCKNPSTGKDFANTCNGFHYLSHT